MTAEVEGGQEYLVDHIPAQELPLRGGQIQDVRAGLKDGIGQRAGDGLGGAQVRQGKPPLSKHGRLWPRVNRNAICERDLRSSRRLPRPTDPVVIGSAPWSRPRPWCS